MASADSTNAMTAVTANLTCYDVATSARGQKTAAVIRDGQPAFWTLPSVATPLFAPSAYKGVSGDSSGKLSLCLNAGPDVMKEAEEIDDWAVNYCTLHSDRLFGKVLTRDQVLDRYNSVVKRSEKYPPFLKLKISDRGRVQLLGRKQTESPGPGELAGVSDFVQGPDIGILVHGDLLRPLGAVD